MLMTFWKKRKSKLKKDVLKNGCRNLDKTNLIQYKLENKKQKEGIQA